MTERLLAVAPGLPSTDLDRTVAYYAILGFSSTYRSPDFMILARDDLELHIARRPEHDPTRTAAWIYFTVSNADVLYREFRGGWRSKSARTSHHDLRHARIRRHRPRRQSPALRFAPGCAPTGGAAMTYLLKGISVELLVDQQTQRIAELGFRPRSQLLAQTGMGLRPGG